MHFMALATPYFQASKDYDSTGFFPFRLPGLRYLAFETFLRPGKVKPNQAIEAELMNLCKATVSSHLYGCHLVPLVGKSCQRVSIPMLGMQNSAPPDTSVWHNDVKHPNAKPKTGFDLSRSADCGRWITRERPMKI